MIRIRAEREKLGLTRPEMARKLRAAATRPGDVPGLDSLIHNMYRWERGEGVSERYRILYCRVLNRDNDELFGDGGGSRRVAGPAPMGVPGGLPAVQEGAGYVVVVLPEAAHRLTFEISGTITSTEPAQEPAQEPGLTLVTDIDA